MSYEKKILNELLNNQRKDVKSENKLNKNDILQISNNINSSIFDKNKCCIWKGYITNKNNNRGSYINFNFQKNKKKALHRLLYENYVDNLNKNEYIKYICKNKGSCCNINHFKKVKSNKIKTKPQKKKENNVVSFD